MNIPLRIRHRFNKSGVFDLRRRVLMKNFLLGNRAKIEYPEVAPSVKEEVEDELDCEIDDNLLEIISVPSESKDEENKVDELVVSDSNVFDTEIEPIPVSESFELNHADKNLDDVKRKKRPFEKRRKSKKKYFFKKKEKKHNSSENSSQNTQSTVCMSSVDSSLLDNKAETKKTSPKKVKKSRFHLRLKRLVHGKKGRSFSIETPSPVENKSIANSFNVINDENKEYSFQIQLRKRQSVKNQDITRSKVPKSVFKLFQSRSSEVACDKKATKDKQSKTCQKRKMNSDQSGLNINPNANRSVSVQTDVTIDPQMRESLHSDYYRASKRSRYDENKYWLRSCDNISEGRILKPINNKIKNEWPRSTFNSSEINVQRDMNKIVRSKSIQENRGIQNQNTTCRRVKSVRLPAQHENSCQEWNDDYRSRLRNRSEEYSKYRSGFASPVDTKFLQISASTHKAIIHSTSSTIFDVSISSL